MHPDDPATPGEGTQNMTDENTIEERIEELEQRVEDLKEEQYRQFEESQPDYV